MLSKHGFDTTLERSLLMSKIKSKNTRPEVLLRKNLWKKGIRYRLNSKKLYGKPDIAIAKYKIVIFIDGEFWHGYNWEIKKQKIKSNREYWIKKIEKNIENDAKTNVYYAKNKWSLFRFWQHQITGNLEECASIILQQITDISNQRNA
jgi:DNA mismatch endonuclease, patch repair protein